MLKRILFLFALAFMASPLVFAQVTTSAISGAVRGPGDDPLVGANVVATHLPTGTKYATSTRGGGQFVIANMRPGGPYTIEITFIGYRVERLDNIFLQLAESFVLMPTLTKTDATLENVILTTGRRSQTFNPNRTGAVTNIGLRQITQSPTISRSINDLTRATPQSNNNSFGGGNYRQSNFTVDGAEFNNSFGIGTSNLPAGGSPISIDALDEISVNITPFDVRQSGFIGAAINAVTRSGTNTFSGSVYTYFRSERQRGDQVGKVKFVRAPEEFHQQGVRFGGPLIKNKLFFFVNYEKENTPRTIQTRVAATTAAPFGSRDNIARPTADSLNYISQYLLTNYGYVTGPYENYTPNVERRKFLARIDWNINANNRVNFRYSQVVGGTPLSMSGSLNSAGTVSGITTTNARTANTALWFKNSNYFQGEDYYSFSGELNSKIGRVSNTLRAAYTFQDENRKSDSQIFPFVDILSTTGVTPVFGNGAPYTSFGYEPFTFGNIRNVKMYSIVDNLSWVTNKHSWTAGIQFESSQTFNGFQPFGTSYYRFATWADFASALDPVPANRKLPTDFVQTFSLSKNFAPAFSSFKFIQYSLYAQDEVSVNKKLRLTFGLRIERPTYPDLPQIVTNPLLAALSFEGGEKLDMGVLPKNKIMWSPRFGFNWDIHGDRSLQIRGGTGIFTGRVPYVWVVSQSGTNNMIQVTQAFNSINSTTGLPSGQVAPGWFNPNPIAYRPAIVPAAGTSVNQSPTVIDPDFKNPQSWKTSLAVDAKIPGGIIASLEGIFNKDLVTIFPRNPNLITPQPMNIAGYPDNRLIYGATNQTRNINNLNNSFVPQAGGAVALTPTVLDNGKKGYYFSLTAKLEKSFSKGLFASVAYVKSIAGNIHDGGGDQPNGVLSGTPTVNGTNYTPMSYSDFVVPDRVVGIFSYRKEYLKHLATTVSLIYNGSINGRFSYTYSGDINRDGQTANDLIYIPRDARNPAEISFGTANRTINGVVFTPAQQAQVFEDYINQDKYLRKHRGQYAERGGGQSPWLNRVDLKFMQDLFVKLGKNRNTIQFTADILNFGNLLNPKWGILKSLNAASILNVTLPSGFAPGGTIPPTFALSLFNNNVITKTFRDNVSVGSTYSVQFGLRYLFN